MVVTLPKAWTDYYRLEPGNTVSVIANGKLIIKPIKADGDEDKG